MSSLCLTLLQEPWTLVLSTPTTTLAQKNVAKRDEKAVVNWTCDDNVEWEAGVNRWAKGTVAVLGGDQHGI